MANCWIQEADYSHNDLGDLGAAAAIRAFEGFDWEERLRKQQFLESAGERSCDPGIGIVADDGRILHVCPTDGGKTLIHYHFAEETRRFWLIRRHQPAMRTKHGLRRGEVAEVIRRFFAADHDWLIAKLAAAQSG